MYIIKHLQLRAKDGPGLENFFESGEKLRRLQSISSSVVIITNEVEGKTIKQGYKTR